MSDTASFEMLELANGEVILRMAGEEGYLLKVDFNNKVSHLLGQNKIEVCREMMVAGIEAAQELQTHDRKISNRYQNETSMSRKDLLIHCDKCNICWDKRYYDNHPCKINQRNSNCMICLENSWDAQQNPRILDCGHIYHPQCINSWFQENYTCPTCKKTAFKPIFMWNAIEAYVNNTRYEDEWMDKWKS